MDIIKCYFVSNNTNTNDIKVINQFHLNKIKIMQGGPKNKIHAFIVQVKMKV